MPYELLAVKMRQLKLNQPWVMMKQKTTSSLWRGYYYLDARSVQTIKVGTGGTYYTEIVSQKDYFCDPIDVLHFQLEVSGLVPTS